MDWRIALITLTAISHAYGFSKYGRSCRDIGCLSSEVCVLQEDPCSFGHTSDCGTYPTCKKKSLVEGSHSEPSRPSVPNPKPQTPTTNFDSPPHYPPPAPPNNNSPYGGSPYGNRDTSHGSSGGNSPYGSSSHGGNSPYGGNPYGANSPYGGNPYGANSPYGGNPNGANSPYGSNGGNSPYGSNNRGGNNPYGSNAHGSSTGGGTIDSILNTLNKYASGGGGGGASSGSGGSLSNIFGNVLNDLTKNSGGLSNIFNTRPIMENPNYSTYGSNSRSANPQNYPSGSQSYTPSQSRNYGQNNAHRSGAATYKPATYGWNVGVTVLTYLVLQYIQTMGINM